MDGGTGGIGMSVIYALLAWLVVGFVVSVVVGMFIRAGRGGRG